MSKIELNNSEKIELKGIESRIGNFIKGSIESNPAYKGLAINLSYELDYIKGSSYKFIHNASASISGSYGLAVDIDNFLDTLPFPSLSSPYTLIIKVDFQKKALSPSTTETSTVFKPIEPRYNFNQIILSPDVRKEIEEGISLIRNRELIYDTWGFGAVDPIQKSVLNLYGPPGTGKTMVAHAIANSLKRPLLALNYSEIESKYVGDAAKNLMAAFNAAKKLNAVLFFDEADSFLGKRIENVTQGSDQALNSLRSQMLILLEEFNGVVVFATTLVTNFDPAFESRILKHIKLDLPNREARADIIRKMIPQKLPTDSFWTDEQLLSASDEIDGLSGREIKGAILEMLLAKANSEGKNAVFCFDDLLQTMKHKKASLEKLKKEENERLKNKILRKLKEKSMEEKCTNDYEQSKGSQINSSNHEAKEENKE